MKSFPRLPHWTPSPLRAGIRLVVLLAALALSSSALGASAAPPSSLLQFTSSGHILGFASDCVYVASGSHALRVQFVNAQPTAPTSAAAQNQSARAAPLSQVSYPNLWAGVTLTYDAPDGAILRSTYRLEPYARVDNIRLRYNAPVTLNADGTLSIAFTTGQMVETAPRAWQEIDGQRLTIPVTFSIQPRPQSVTWGHSAFSIQHSTVSPSRSRWGLTMQANRCSLTPR